VRGSIAGRDDIGGRTGGEDARAADGAGIGWVMGGCMGEREEPGADGMVMRGAPFAGGAGIAIGAVTSGAFASAVAAKAGGSVTGCAEGCAGLAGGTVAGCAEGCASFAGGTVAGCAAASGGMVGFGFDDDGVGGAGGGGGGAIDGEREGRDAAAGSGGGGRQTDVRPLRQPGTKHQRTMPATMVDSDANGRGPDPLHR
jgi:hypothetical protein